MHIPDGYLGPQTCLPAWGVMVPLWAAAVRKVQRTLRTRQVPLLALGAAFSFLLMMFNVPIPGGTTGHAVGGALVAILLGPWAACVAVSLALAVQALLFGDGGVTSLGANCLTMAFVMPFTGWWIYRLARGGAGASPRRSRWAAALAGYAGLNAAALLAAVLFGIQPALAHDAAGRALYCPYALNVALPAMMLEHLLLFGFVEAVVTGLVVAYLQRSETPLAAAAPPIPVTIRRFALLLIGMLLLSPLGLLLPAWFGAGDAWGEWSLEDLAADAGFQPKGMARLASLWRSPMPDYALPGQGEAALPGLSLTYLLSAVVGASVLGLLVWLVRVSLLRRNAPEPHS